MIPTNPPPTFRNPDQWSEPFKDFVSQCLVKNPENRATATQLLQVALLLSPLSSFFSLSIVHAIATRSPSGLLYIAFISEASHWQYTEIPLMTKLHVNTTAVCLLMFPATSSSPSVFQRAVSALSIYGVHFALLCPQAPFH